MRYMRWILLLLAMSAGCAFDEADTPISDVTASLGNQGGCADIILHAWDDAGTARLELRLPPLIDDTRQAGGKMTYSFTIPASGDGASAVLLIGEALITEACPDYVLPESQVYSELIAISGTIEATVTIAGEASPFENPAQVTAELRNMVFAGDGQEIRLPRYVFTNIRVGWLPG